MNQTLWVLCEQSTKWASAIRTAIERDPSNLDLRIRVCEVRRLDELTEQVSITPHCLVLVEARRTNITQVLEWLADARQNNRQARFVVLLANDIAISTCDSASLSQKAREVLRYALGEAGAAEVIDSPRRLRGLLELGRRYAALTPDEPIVHIEGETPSLTALWASLPWQAE